MKPVKLLLMATFLIAATLVTAAATAEAAGPRDEIQVFNGKTMLTSGVVYTLRPDDDGFRVYIGQHVGPARPFMVLRDGRVKLGDSDWVLFTMVEKRGQQKVMRGKSARSSDALYTVRRNQVFHGNRLHRSALVHELVQDRLGDARLCVGGRRCAHQIFTIRGAQPEDLEAGLLPLLTVLAESELIPLQ